MLVVTSPTTTSFQTDGSYSLSGQQMLAFRLAWFRTGRRCCDNERFTSRGHRARSGASEMGATRELHASPVTDWHQARSFSHLGAPMKHGPRHWGESLGGARGVPGRCPDESRA